MSHALTANAEARRKTAFEKIFDALLWLFVATSSITFIEPAPYDVILLFVVVMWLFGGFTVHRSVLPLFFLMLIHNLAGCIALAPYLDDRDAVVYVAYSLYLFIATIIFAVIFSQDSLRRTDLLLSGYLVAALIASIAGILGWFDVAGLGKTFSMYNRASGPFKDPNVFGPFLIAGYLFVFRKLLMGEMRTIFGAIANAAVMMVLLFGVFLSFSRGAWVATVVATLVSAGCLYATSSDRRTRSRIVSIFVFLGAMAAVGLLVALSFDSIQEVFAQRAALTQEYDAGETGRFGNQIRSIPQLLELPNGFGPLRFRHFYGIEPHNSYVSAFANFGWLGGFSFILWVGVCCFVGFRLCLVKSPFMRNAQTLWPPVFGFFLQAFQIDIDHWRYLYLLLGAVWGLEAARQKWAARTPAASGSLDIAPTEVCGAQLLPPRFASGRP